MNTDALAAAVAAWRERQGIPSSELVNELVRSRVPVSRNRQGQGAIQFAPAKEHTCRMCERFKVHRGDATKIIRHMATIPHLASEFEVSPFELARAIRGVRVMDGDNPEAGKRRVKRRGKWNTDKTAEQAVRHASLMLVRWQKRLEKVQAKVKQWARRVRTAEALITERDETP